jgi:hypothetical protein
MASFLLCRPLRSATRTHLPADVESLILMLRKLGRTLHAADRHLLAPSIDTLPSHALFTTHPLQCNLHPHRSYFLQLLTPQAFLLSPSGYTERGIAGSEHSLR